MTDQTPPPAAPQPAAPLTEAEDRQWASFAHLGGVIGLLPALIIFLVFKDRGAFTRDESKEALNFQITALMAEIVSFILMAVLIGFLIWPLVVLARALFSILASAVGAPRGIVAGQAWESEATVNLRQYQRAKTGALFVAATMMGAVASGADPPEWRTRGDRMGEAYQVADDIRDIAETAAETGKPAGQDAAHDRPSTARELGLDGALDLLHALLADAAQSIPDCDGADGLRALVSMQAARLTPKHLVRHAV